MTIPSEHGDSSAQAAPGGTSLQADGRAEATVAEIKAENQALKEADRAAEAQAKAAAEQAKQLAQVTGEVLEELKDMKEGAI